MPYEQDYLDKYYRYDDGDGRLYGRADICAAGIRNGKSGEPWRGIDPGEKGMHWKFTVDRLEKLDAVGQIYWPPGCGMPRYKRYRDELKGRLVTDIWDDINRINPMAKERLGYPTQKPLALLERIIEASSEPGDVVLDPFAGCATACVAAEKLDRQWVGIDLSSKAVELVNERLRSEMGDLFHYGLVTSRKDVPQRTDIDSPKDYRTHKHVIYGEQEGHCVGCMVHFEFRHLTVDHIVPRKRGGTGHKDNLQLLCGHCNSVKGDRPMEYLLAQLADAGVLTG